MQNNIINIIQKPLSCILLLGCLLGFSACGGVPAASEAAPAPEAVSSTPEAAPPETEEGSGEALVLSSTDYSDMNNWLRFGNGAGKDVDIFVVYPTLAFSEEEADLPYVRIDSSVMRTAAGVWLNDLDSVISPHANVYAPLYRQLNLAVLPTMSGAEFMPLAAKTPREDVFAAFAYYLEQVNKGERPFILMGHSQGAQMVCELATRFLGNAAYAAYNQNHIATYVIGMSVTPEEVALNPNLKFSQSHDDTGVILSWNTTAPAEAASGVYKSYATWKDGALVTNPISWQTNEEPAGPVPFAKEYTGQTGPMSIAGSADAIVDNTRGLLMVTSLDETRYAAALGDLLSRYHGYDIWFFADSITKNIEDRIAAHKE